MQRVLQAVGVSKEGLAACSTGSPKGPRFAADPERALCAGKMKKYSFRMTEAKERTGSLQKTEAPAIQCQSQVRPPRSEE